MPSFEQRQKPLIVLADHDEITRDVACAVLIEAGFDTIATDNGIDAVAHFAEHAPDLIILDVMMPGQDGISACRAIREVSTSRNVPILILTGKDDVASVRNAFDAGATDFLTKPINWTLFTHRVRFSLRTAQLDIDLRKNQFRLVSAQRMAKLGYLELDLSNHTLHCTDELLSILGTQSKTLISNFESFLAFVPSEHRASVSEFFNTVITTQAPSNIEFALQLADGRQRRVFSRAEIMLDRQESPGRLVAIVHDLTERAEAELRLAFLTNYDPVTSLPNRTLFMDRLNVAIREARRHAHLFAIIIVDIDRFKNVNQSYGHEFGNEVLRQIAVRIQSNVRECDTVARLGSGEYALIINELQEAEDVIRVAHTIKNTMKTPLRCHDQEVFATLGIGVSIYPVDSTEPELLLKNAETAMHEAKRNGRSQFRFFTDDMNNAARERMEMETELRRALENREFILYFQPQIDIQSGHLWGAEALIRWKHPRKGIIPPLHFIPTLEDTGLILPVGEWALRAACDQIVAWHNDGFDLTLSVNLSAKQFNDPQLLEGILNALEQSRVDPQRLELELTESTLMSDEQRALRIMSEIRSHGVQLAIDDFGTGYSSLSYLKKLPVNHLKVDRSFVINMAEDDDDRTIVQSTVDLAHNLGLEVIAEGIESVNALQLLKEMNCEIAQGFYIAHPMEPGQFDVWLRGFQA